MYENIRRYAVNSIRVVNFRNLDLYECSPGPRQIITGDNGVGKSNLLEAFSLLYPGQGLRSTKYADMAKFGSKHWSIFATVSNGFNTKNIEVLYDDGVKTVRVNKNPVSSMSDLAENIVIIWLTPQIISNFDQTQASRRSFFDRLVYTFDNKYASHCIGYNKAMAERSKILRNNIMDDRWLSAVERSMADCMWKIIQARHQIFSQLQEILSLELQVTGSADQLATQVDGQEVLIKTLKANRGQDAIRGGSIFGTHRTRFNIMRQGVPFDFCSTGEQKSMILELVFAQARLKIMRDSTYPILLLDDIMDGLCNHSQRNIIEALQELQCQFIMTGSQISDKTGLQVLNFNNNTFHDENRVGSDTASPQEACAKTNIAETTKADAL